MTTAVASRLTEEFKRRFKMVYNNTLDLQKELNDAQAKVEVARTKYNTAAEENNLYARLQESWKERDPGKSRECSFFMRNGNRVVAVDLLDEDDKQEAAKRYQCVPLDDVDEAPCPRCSKPALRTESVLQTEDSPSGDEWRQQEALLCLGCGTITKQEPEFSAYRF